MGLIEKLDRFPPALVIVVARKNRGRTAMSLGEIARASGLSLRQVKIMAHRATWRGARMETIDSLAQACGVDVLRPKRHVDWFKRRKKTAWRGRETFVAGALKALLSRSKQDAGQ